MSKPYSEDLRERVVAAVEGGLSCRQAGKVKFKELLRQAQARTVDALWHLIGRTLNLFTPEECTNYIRHCG